MKTRRKIWSIPIAALALVLMLAGALVVSGIVQAQTIDRSTFHMVVGEIEALTVEVKGLDRSDDDNGKFAAISTASDALDLSGTGEAGFTPSPGDAPTGTTASETQDVNITPGPDVAAGVYNLTLTVEIDSDTTENSDTTGGDSDSLNDADRTVTSSVTIYVVGPPTTATQFHGDPNTSLPGQPISDFGRDLRTDRQSIQITGMGPNSKILADEETADNGADAASGTLARVGNLDFSVDPSDRTKIIAEVFGTIADATVSFTVNIDTDVTKDAPDDDNDSTNTDDDGIKDNDPDLSLTGDANIDIDVDAVTSLGWGDADETPAEGDIGPAFAFTMLSNEPSGSAIGNVYVDGAELDTDGDGTPDDGEFLDGILLDSDGNAQAMFAIKGVNATVADNQALQLIYNSGALNLGTHTYRLSVNGDSGIAHRTISDGGDGDNPLINVTVTVNPVNEGPMGPDNHPATVTETVEGAGILASGDEVVDMSGLASDTNVLVYDLKDGDDAGLFGIDSATGKVTVGSVRIADNAVTTAAVADNPLTTAVNEAKAAVYGRDPDDGGELVDPSSLYSDITYEFTVNVSDGNAASSHDIAVTLTVNVNEPVTEMGDISGDAPSYKTTDVQNHEIVDLNDYLSGSDSPDDNVMYIWTVTPVNPPFGIYNDAIRVNYPGPTRSIPEDPETEAIEAWDPELNGWTIRVLVGDAFANGTGPEACKNDDDEDVICEDVTNLPNGVDAVLDFTIKQIPGPPLQSFDLVFEIDENAAAGTVVGTLGPEVEGAVAFSIISGTGGARDDFAVDETTGEITVVNGRDYDAVGAENNIVLLVDAFGANGIRLGAVIAGIAIQDIDEDPTITPLVVGADGTSSEIPWVYETAQIGDPVVTKPVGQEGPAATDADTIISAMDPEGADITYSISSTGKVPFAVDSSTGALTVTGALDRETAGSHTFTVKAADPAGNSDEMEVTVHVLNSNETPQFTSPTGDGAVTTIPENTGNAHVIFTFTATDEDRDDLTFTLREGQSRDLFVIEDAKSEIVDGEEVWSGELHVKTDVILDFEDAGYDPRVHVEANDPEGLNATLLLTVNLNNVNDNDPVFDTLPAATSLSVPENTARGFVLANYSASDADGDTVTYNLMPGGQSKSFEISDSGDLMTLESLDADRQVPCGASGCSVTVEATDGERNTTAVVTITVTALEDSVSTLGVTKANPVPGTESGHPSTALAGTKTTASSAVPERPGDMPNTGAAYDVTAPINFVEADWANWGTILRIEVTAESPSVGCGNGNQCVVIDVNSDSADTSIKLEAYRSATQENKFVAALMLVELTENATDSDSPAYAHSDGSVARLKVDEEDEIEIEFGNLRGSLDVENEDPEISNFAPDHEAAFDDADVDYTFTVTDSNSGMPEPEDLPDGDGDADYTPVVALISTGQCETHDGSAATVKTDGGTLSMAASINEDESLYCPGTAQDGEYDASGGGFGFAPIRDDKDFDEIDDGFDVETTIVLRENKKYFVTFIACDNAGNCSFYDPDGNDDFEELAQITVDHGGPGIR